MNPCADLTVTTTSTSTTTPPPLPSRNGEQYGDERAEAEGSDNGSISDEYDNYEISVYADDDELEGVGAHQETAEIIERQWRYEDEPYYDDIFQDDEFIEDHFNSDEEDSDPSSNNNASYYDNDSLYEETRPTTTTNNSTAKVIHLEGASQHT